MPELSRLPALRFFALLVLLLLTVGASAQAADIASGVWITQIAVFLLPALILARLCNLSASRLLRFSFRLEWPLLVLVLIAAASNYMVAAGAMGLMEVLIPPDWPRVDAAAILEMEAGLRLALIVGGIIIAAPLCEETAFRGFMQQPLTARLGPWPGILVTSFFFSVLHLDPVGFIARMELGIVFGWLLWRTGSLWAPILAHAVNNGVATLLFFALDGAEMAEMPDSDLGTGAMVASTLGLMLVGLLILIPTLSVVHRATKKRAEARLEVALRPLDPSRPIGLAPVASLVTSALLLTLAFVLALAIAFGLAREPADPPIVAAVALRGSTQGDDVGRQSTTQCSSRPVRAESPPGPPAGAQASRWPLTNKVGPAIPRVKSSSTTSPLTTAFSPSFNKERFASRS